MKGFLLVILTVLGISTSAIAENKEFSAIEIRVGQLSLTESFDLNNDAEVALDVVVSVAEIISEGNHRGLSQRHEYLVRRYKLGSFDAGTTAQINKNIVVIKKDIMELIQKNFGNAEESWVYGLSFNLYETDIGSDYLINTSARAISGPRIDLGPSHIEIERQGTIELKREGVKVLDLSFNVLD